jgi:sulfonate transport system ATP-binding protein
VADVQLDTANRPDRVRPATEGDAAANVVLRIEGVSKSYVEEGTEALAALADINLSITGSHSFVSVIGPSGCGKSTLLKLVAGIETPTAGSIVCRGRPLTGVNRDVAYVPQGRGLFPWMTLRANLEFPLRLAGVPAAERRRVARDWIARVDLTGFENSFPRQLSGGMEKRGALARALVAGKPILLMDEPFGPLDAQTRLALQQHLMTLWAEVETTVIFITHDVVEAIALADRVVVLSERPGRILEVVPVTLPRPRDLISVYDYDEFRTLHHELQRMIFRDRG